MKKKKKKKKVDFDMTEDDTPITLNDGNTFLSFAELSIFF
jgi:hypothetical protein